MMELLEEERTKAEIARQIYNLRSELRSSEREARSGINTTGTG